MLRHTLALTCAMAFFGCVGVLIVATTLLDLIDEKGQA